MTKLTRITNQQLQGRKQASAPKVFTWQTVFQHSPRINVCLFIMVIGLGISYLQVVNSNVATTFRWTELNGQLSQMKDQNQKLQIDVAEALSLQRVSSASTDYDLVATKSVEYLSTANPSVALSD